MIRTKPQIYLVIAFLSFSLALSVSQSQDEKKGTEKQSQTNADRKIASYEDLVAAYERQNIKIEKNTVAKSLLFQTSRKNFKGVMVIKWDDVNGVIHLIQTWPLTVPKEKQALFLKAAQTLNHGFLFPGIGVNLSNGGTYYRLSIPVSPRGYLHDYEVGTFTRFAINKSAEFLPTIEKVLDEKVKIDELILFHQKYLRGLAAKKTPTVKLSGQYARTADEVEWVLDFSDPTKVKVLRAGKLGVESQITIKGDEMRIEDKGGPFATKEPGVYRVVMSGTKLTFRAIDDKAAEREKVLTGGVWSAKK